MLYWLYFILFFQKISHITLVQNPSQNAIQRLFAVYNELLKKKKALNERLKTGIC